MLDSIEKVFSENLRRLRGERTQAEIAELAGVPLRSYQKAEAEQIPRPENRRALVRAFGLKSETELFVDPDLFPSAPSPTPAEALEVLAREIGKPKLVLSPVAAELVAAITDASGDEAKMALLAGRVGEILGLDLSVQKAKRLADNKRRE